MKKIIIAIFQKLSLMIGLFIIIVFLIPNILGINTFVVLSGSMEPGIKTGSVVYINSRTKANEIVVGDIIGYKSKLGEITHRVVKINSDKTFVTKGDNNDKEDPENVTYEMYKGKTLFAVPYLGRIIAFAKSLPGIITILIFIILNLLCIIFDKKIYGEEKKVYQLAELSNNEEFKEKFIEEIDGLKERMINEFFVQNSDNKESSSVTNDISSNNDNIQEKESNEKIENLDCTSIIDNSLEEAKCDNQTDNKNSLTDEDKKALYSKFATQKLDSKDLAEIMRKTESVFNYNVEKSNDIIKEDINENVNNENLNDIVDKGGNQNDIDSEKKENDVENIVKENNNNAKSNFKKKSKNKKKRRK